MTQITLRVSEIKESKKYRKEIPRQTNDERARMLISIKSRGIEKPIEISNLTGLLVDGYERFEVGQLAEIENYPVTYKDFSSELDEFQYLVDNVLCRRNLSTWWIGKLNHINVGLEKKLARERQKSAITILENNDDTFVQGCTKVKGRATDIATKGKNIGARTQDKVEKIIQSGDKNLIKQLDSNEITTNKAEQILHQKEIESSPIPSLPKGKFTAILEDPGWFFNNKNIGGSGKSGAGYKYRVLPTTDIAKIPVSKIAADNAVLYMWTTNQHLMTGSMLMKDFVRIAYGSGNEETEYRGNVKVQSDALAVMKCHGFDSKYIITWEKENKEGWGGYSFNNVTEHLLIGIRGKVKPFGLIDKTIIRTQYKKSKDSHSKKPEEMWQLIEKCIEKTRGNHRKLEMNCRNPRKGWYPHGDQITTKDIQEWQKLK